MSILQKLIMISMLVIVPAHTISVNFDENGTELQQELPANSGNQIKNKKIAQWIAGAAAAFLVLASAGFGAGYYIYLRYNARRQQSDPINDTGKPKGPAIKASHLDDAAAQHAKVNDIKQPTPAATPTTFQQQQQQQAPVAREHGAPTSQQTQPAAAQAMAAAKPAQQPVPAAPAQQQQQQQQEPAKKAAPIQPLISKDDTHTDQKGVTTAKKQSNLKHQQDLAMHEAERDFALAKQELDKAKDNLAHLFHLPYSQHHDDK